MSASTVASRPPGRSVQVLAKELVALHPDVNSHMRLETPPRCSRRLADPDSVRQRLRPDRAGFVTSLARPGGDLTGVLHYEASIAGKWLRCSRRLRRALPGPLSSATPR